MTENPAAKKDFWGNVFFWLITGPVSVLAALPLLLIGTANILAKLLFACFFAALVAGIIALLTSVSFSSAFYAVMLTALIFTAFDMMNSKSE